MNNIYAQVKHITVTMRRMAQPLGSSRSIYSAVICAVQSYVPRLSLGHVVDAESPLLSWVEEAELSARDLHRFIAPIRFVDATS